MSKPRIWSADSAIQLAVQRAPGAPHATDDYRRFGCRPHPRGLAMSRAHVQFNPDDMCSVLAFDVDHEFNGPPHLGACWAWERHNLPPPSWITINRENGHAHLVYVLREPVKRLSEKTQKPVWLLNVVRRAMTMALGADPGYANFLTMNPLNGAWQVLSFDVVYDLATLCEWIPDCFLEAAKRTAKILLSAEEAAACSSFPWAFQATAPLVYRHWAKVHAEASTTGHSATLEQLARAELTNAGTGELMLSEPSFQQLMRRLIKWALAHFDADKSQRLLKARQRRRGKKSGQVRHERTAALVKDAVLSLRQAGERITPQTVARLVGRDRSVISRCYKHLLT